MTLDPEQFDSMRLELRRGSLVLAVLARLRDDQRGEGVISTAIAVLIMAFLGAAMWLAFQTMFETTTANTTDQVEQIGR